MALIASDCSATCSPGIKRPLTISWCAVPAFQMPADAPEASPVCTIIEHDGPNRLGLWCNVLVEHRMALIASDCGKICSPAPNGPNHLGFVRPSAVGGRAGSLAGMGCPPTMWP